MPKDAWRCALVAAAVSFACAAPAQVQSVIFDFDSGTPALPVGQNTPLAQMSNGITAIFAASSDPAFSIQTDASGNWRLSQFSGNYLAPNNITRNTLYVSFSVPVTSISFTFATADFQQVEVPSTLQLNAYSDSGMVGTATAHGVYANDTMPMGTLTFNSAGRPFSAAQILIPVQTRGATSFLVDNIVVTPAPAGSFASACAASYAAGGSLAAGSIASGFGQSLAAAAEAASSLPLPTLLANTTVTVKDSAGVERAAPLFYVGPAQINYLVPPGTAAGAATISVTSGGRVSATGTASIDRVAPGLFTANLDGKGPPAGYATALAPDQTQTVQDVARCGTAAGTCATLPIDLGPAGTQVALTLYGTGIRGRAALSGVTARIGGVDAPVLYAGEQSEFAGLDQVNLSVPRSLAGRGETDLILTVEGKAANTVRVNIK